jgi:transposase InsO family protein
VNVYPFIEAEKTQRRNVKRACQLLEVSRSAYYAHRSGPSQRARQDAELTGRIIAVHDASAGTYGAPRVHAELRAQGRRHSRKRIARLMRAAGRRRRAPRRWRTTTIPDPAASARADLVGRDFATAPEQVNARWCGDITYINTWEGWLYLTVTWNLADRMAVTGRAGPSRLAGGPGCARRDCGGEVAGSGPARPSGRVAAGVG